MYIDTVVRERDDPTRLGRVHGRVRCVAAPREAAYELVTGGATVWRVRDRADEAVAGKRRVICARAHGDGAQIVVDGGADVKERGVLIGAEARTWRKDTGKVVRDLALNVQIVPKPHDRARRNILDARYADGWHAPEDWHDEL